MPTTPEPGEKVWQDNSHRWTWIHPCPQRGRCVCVDCEYVRVFPIRRESESSCKRSTNRNRRKRKKK
jgi:hypothetical protein